MSKRTRWDERLSVTTTKKTLVGHAGAVLLRRCADQVGLTTALAAAFPAGRTPTWWDRGLVLVSVAVGIALGGTCMSDVEALLAHQMPVFGAPPSDSTVRRGLDLDQDVLARIAKVRAKVRAHVWDLLTQRPGGFPWVTVAGKVLTGWIVIDADATLITAHSPKQGAASTWKKGFGFHPLGAWCSNTSESLAMQLRQGSAGSNTVADHIQVLGAAIAQIPARFRRKILIRIDGAGATHELLEHLNGMNTTRRKVRFTVGWAITSTDEDAIALLPEQAWSASLTPDGQIDKEAQVAELTGLDRRGDTWIPGLRLLVRRTRPSRRHAKKLTVLEKRTGWRYAIIATNITRIHGVPGTGHPQWLDLAHRLHAGVEDRVRTNKSMGLRNLPSKSWRVNTGWVLAANIAADLDAWTRLLGLHDEADLVRAEPETLRYRLWHLPATLAFHARRRTLAIAETWPWATAFTTCWQRLGALPSPV